MGVEEQVEETEEEVRIVVKEVKEVVTDGPTSRRVRITLHRQSVKNITFLGSQLIGVKNQTPALGKISGFQKLSNETVASLTLVTYKIHYITTSIEKYMQLLT